MIELAHFQVLSAALFAIGLYGVLARRSAVLILMSIELMLNAVSVNLVGFAAFVDFTDPQRALGQVIVINLRPSRQHSLNMGQTMQD